MRAILIMLGCAALLADGAAAADHQFYRVDIRFSKIGADDQVFMRDRDQCFHDTNTWRRLVSEDIRPDSSSRFQVSTAEHHGAEFHHCMTAKGYRADPNGRFRVSFSTAL